MLKPQDGARRRRGGLRPLAVLWIVVLVGLGAGAATLQVLGPPARPAPPVQTASVTPPPPASATPAPPTPAPATPAPPTPAPPTLAPPTLAPPTLAPPTLAPPTLAPPTLAPAPAPLAATGLRAAAPPAPAVPAPPPPAAPVQAARPPSAAAPAGPAPATVAALPPEPPPLPRKPGDIRVADPNPALLEPDPAQPGQNLPRIGPDGRRPMQAYAGATDPSDTRPKVALVLDGMGISATYTEDAIEQLPAAVTLAFSPYALEPGNLLESARSAGHEILVSIPMEPEGYPLNDPGSHALLTGRDPSVNLANLNWALAQIPGAVGATSGLDGLRGERYAASTAAFDDLQTTLARRGLLFLDARPGSPAPAHVAGRGVDLVLDEPPTREAIELKLAQLEAIARDHGAAVGLAGPPRPVTTERLAAWTAMASRRGFDLVPISATVATRGE